jgi:hypothetical protein
MAFDKYEMGYFIQQTALAVKSLGFEDLDVELVQTGLDTTFNKRCSPPTTLIPASAGPQLQSICIAEDCMLDPNATCDAYPNHGTEPAPEIANATLVGNVTKPGTNTTGTEASASGSSVASATKAASTGTACKVVGSLAAVGGAAIFALAA